MENNPKQRIVEKIKKSTNILVTVSRDPSVDELSAALSLTLMLNKMDKHATAVFSGSIPPAITFLEPQKTFEQNTDSLRDFIIALDKEKADRLRYKVEDDVVRIYITPYRTNITERDLDFSQGDFNVELIIALGVKKQSDLDEAISAHGRILHDATIVTVNTDESKSSIGSIEWNDIKASSLCEMLMSLSEALQANLLDEQIATGLLTGIVAATDRFSNDHTSPRVMTMSAQLMSAGANQQLIADELAQNGGGTEEVSSNNDDDNNPRSGELTENTSQRIERSDAQPNVESGQVADETTSQPPDSAQETPPEEPANNDGSMHIDHQNDNAAAQAASGEASAEQAIENALATPVMTSPSSSLSVADLQKDIAAESASLDEAAGADPVPERKLMTEPKPESAPPESPVSVQETPNWRNSLATEEPAMGGTLNATADEAAEARRREEMSGRNHTILSHDSPQDESPGSHGVNFQPPSDQPAAGAPSYDTPALTKGKDLQPITMQPIASNPDSLQTASSFDTPGITPTSEPTIEQLQQAAHQSAEPVDVKAQSLDAARSEINNLFDAGSYEMTPLSPQDASTQPQQAAPTQPEPMETTPAPVPVEAPSQPPIASGSMNEPLAPLPPVPPMPDFSTLPPLPGDAQPPAAPHPGAMPVDTPPAAQPAPTPSQFQIPGQ